MGDQFVTCLKAQLIYHKTKPNFRLVWHKARNLEYHYIICSSFLINILFCHFYSFVKCQMMKQSFLFIFFQPFSHEQCPLMLGIQIQIMFAQVGSISNPQSKIIGVAYNFIRKRMVNPQVCALPFE